MGAPVPLKRILWIGVIYALTSQACILSWAGTESFQDVVYENGRVLISRAHKWSYLAWASIGHPTGLRGDPIRDAVLVHFDSHGDLAGGPLPPFEPEQTELKRVRDYVENSLTVENFIMPALAGGFFKHIIWVQPKIRYYSGPPVDLALTLDGSSGLVRISGEQHSVSFDHIAGVLHAGQPAGRLVDIVMHQIDTRRIPPGPIGITLVGEEDLLQLLSSRNLAEEQVVLSIDLDFFATHAPGELLANPSQPIEGLDAVRVAGSIYPSFNIVQSQLSSSIEILRLAVADLPVSWVTIAESPNYTPGETIAEVENKVLLAIQRSAEDLFDTTISPHALDMKGSKGREALEITYAHGTPPRILNSQRVSFPPDSKDSRPDTSSSDFSHLWRTVEWRNPETYQLLDCRRTPPTTITKDAPAVAGEHQPRYINPSTRHPRAAWQVRISPLIEPSIPRSMRESVVEALASELGTEAEPVHLLWIGPVDRQSLVLHGWKEPASLDEGLRRQVVLARLPVDDLTSILSGPLAQIGLAIASRMSRLPARSDTRAAAALEELAPSVLLGRVLEIITDGSMDAHSLELLGIPPHEYPNILTR